MGLFGYVELFFIYNDVRLLSFLSRRYFRLVDLGLEKVAHPIYLLAMELLLPRLL